MPQQDYTKPYYAGAAQPLFNLSVGGLIPTNFDGSNSESIVATNLPVKSTIPFYKIYSTIGNGNYRVNTDEFNVVGICGKQYVSGDFIYGMTNSPMFITVPRKITSIKIDIRDNEGNEISLDDDNTVTFKLIQTLEAPKK